MILQFQDITIIWIRLNNDWKNFKNYSTKIETKVKKETVYSNAKKLYSKLLSIYYDDYNDITDEEKEKIDKTFTFKRSKIY